ncbi:YbjQ family protein [Arthrobacter sp. NA-172]|uniref:YbjQ family protein n=1 Tax=Arthrobacter sp. NA-172 TaxID=3367524 RepID=UPI0037550EF4
MLIVTSNKIPGHRIDAVFGEVMGLTVRSRDIGAQVMAGFRSLGGGELPEMTKALYESRQEVMARMVTEAQQRGANAIVAMRFDTSEMGGNWTEVCAYGTAVFAIPLAEGEPGATGQSIYLTSAAAQQSTQPTTPAAPVAPAPQTPQPPFQQ